MRDSLKTFVESAHSTILVVSLGGAFFLAVIGTALFGPDTGTSHGWKAWQLFWAGAWPIYLICALFALPGVLHWLLGRRNAHSAGERKLLPSEVSSFQRRTEKVRAEQTLWRVCLCYGAAYGLIAGAVCGIGLGPGLVVFMCALGGLMMGTLGACVYAAVGRASAGPVGWGIAGALGGAVPAVLVWFVAQSRMVISPPPSILLMGLIGAGLGVTVACGLHSGKSRVPGVMPLVELIQEVTVAKQRGKASSSATVMVPSAPPTRRGDETTPADR